ncbi:MAG TPA: hypothetical protein DCR59_04780 [Dehalococcoidia bacterium]|nr:hypothetical protein [Dehalococcoidia bacterium]
MGKITSHIYMTNGLRGTGVLSTNIYLLLDTKLTIINTGYKGRVSQICRVVKKLGYSLSDVENIILTHYHIDHTGNLLKLRQLTGANVIAHTDDAPYIEGRLPHPCPKALRQFKFMKCFWSPDPIDVDVKVEDGDILPVLGGIKIIHTPGHTLGSISLYIPQEDALIIGDLVANTYKLSLPSGEFTVNISQEIRLIQKIADMEFNIVCFGHGLPLIKNASDRIEEFSVRLKKYHY